MHHDWFIIWIVAIPPLIEPQTSKTTVCIFLLDNELQNLGSIHWSSAKIMRLTMIQGYKNPGGRVAHTLYTNPPH